MAVSNRINGFARLRRRARLGLGVAAILGLSGFVGQGASPVSASGGTATCSGTFQSPGTLAGTYGSVRITGVCFVDAGAVQVRHDVTLAPGSALVAAFGLNDLTGTGTSSLSVGGNLLVEHGASLFLGCDPQSFPCFDDNPANPTLFSPADVDGNLTSQKPLGVIVHNSTIRGNVDQDGGDGQFNCIPRGVFAVPPPSPVYSAYEDSTIHGHLSVTDLTSCWLGVARDRIGGALRLVNNQLADPDGAEVLSNHVAGDLVCRHNSFVWDTAQATFGQTALYPRTPTLTNTVRGDRIGQCVLASPATQGGPFGPGPF
jgi:hypothetical protein